MYLKNKNKAKNQKTDRNAGLCLDRILSDRKDKSGHVILY